MLLTLAIMVAVMAVSYLLIAPLVFKSDLTSTIADARRRARRAGRDAADFRFQRGVARTAAAATGTSQLGRHPACLLMTWRCCS